MQGLSEFWPLPQAPSQKIGRSVGVAPNRRVLVKGIDSALVTCRFTTAPELPALLVITYFNLTAGSYQTATVNRLSQKATISGEFERPGRYQLLEDEGLHLITNYFGNALLRLVILPPSR